MNTHISPLRKLGKELIQKIKAGALDSDDLDRWSDAAEQVESSVQNALLNYPEDQQRMFLKLQLQKVIDTDNQFYRAAKEMNEAAQWMEPVHNLSYHLYHSLPGSEFDHLLLPESLQAAFAVEQQAHWESIRENWISLGLLDEPLLNIASLPLKELFRGRADYSIGDYLYLVQYLDGLESLVLGNEPWLIHPDHSLVRLLIAQNQNHALTFQYITYLIKDCYTAAHTKGGQLELLKRMQTDVAQISETSKTLFVPKGQPIKDELIGWIGLELTYVADRNDKALDLENWLKLIYELPVDELAVLYRLEYDQKLLRVKSLDELAGQMVKLFSSKKQSILSKDSLISKFSCKEIVPLENVKGHLKDMIEKVDEYLKKVTR